MAAFDLGVERVSPLLVEAFASESRWLDRIKAALAALLRFIEAEPALGRVLVMAPGGAERAMRRRIEAMDALAAALDPGLPSRAAGWQAPDPAIAEAGLGAAVAILQRGLLSEPPTAPIDLFGPIVSVIVLPYRGPAIARHELVRPAPPPRSSRRGSARDDGPEPPARLTYRTTRVLEAIADYPGASNREVAERAGIVDQGQVSKLLCRLEARGMIEKLAERRTRGAPNSWQLTTLGKGLLIPAEDRRRRAPGG